MMQFASFIVCFLCISVNAAGNTRKLRGSTARHDGLAPWLRPRWTCHDGLACHQSFQQGEHHRSRRRLRIPPPSVLAPRTDQGYSRRVEEKPWLLKKAETFHDEWIKPVSSIKNFAVANQAEIIVSALIWLTFILVVAFFYHRSPNYNLDMGSKPLDAVDPVELSTWKSEWYEFYRYPEIFFWSCCCPCIRWAHTMDLLQFMDYWPAFFLFFLLEAMNELTGFVFFGLCLAAVLVFYRQKTRKLFGMENYATCTGFTMDCLGFCFCWPCFIAQEANHVTQATKLGWTKELADKTGLFSGRREPSASQEG